MKKQFLVLAGSALLLASCGENKTEAPAQSQAQIDSAINAKVAEHDAEVARKNDSTLKAIEAEKAMAEAAAAANNKGGGKKPVKSTHTTTPVVTPTPPPVQPSNPKDTRFNTNTDGSQKAPDPNAPNKKADRFNK